MKEAADRAKGVTDPNDDRFKEHRTFLFHNAVLLLHELIHFFITFLSQSQELTPMYIQYDVTPVFSTSEGESGRYLEQLVFGGTIDTWRDDTIQDTHVR